MSLQKPNDPRESTWDSKLLQTVNPRDAEGKLHGIQTLFYLSGALEQVTNWTHGLRNGPEKTFYENGQLTEEMNYLDNLLDGEIKSYYESGQLEIKRVYSSGMKNDVFLTKTETSKKSRAIQMICTTAQ